MLILSQLDCRLERGTYTGPGKEPVQSTGFRHGEGLSEARIQNRKTETSTSVV